MIKTRQFPNLPSASAGPGRILPGTLLPGAILLGAALFAAPGMADPQRQETHVITIKTGDAEVVEADVSDLELGESLSFVTETGRTIDLLKAPEGLEIYLDGELLQDGAPEELQRKHDALLHERIEIVCDGESAADCEALEWNFDGDVEFDVELADEAGDHEFVIIRKEIRED